MQTELFDITEYNISSRTVLIEASAGTGKTYTITSIVMRFIIEKGFNIEDILVVTFTEAAAAELKDRIFTRLNEIDSILSNKDVMPSEDDFLSYIAEKYSGDVIAAKRVRLAMRSFDMASIFTIHGFCFRVLCENAFETGSFFEQEILSNDKDILLKSCEDFYRKFISSCSESESFVIYQKKLFPDSIFKFVSSYIGYANLKIKPEFVKDDISPYIESFLEAKNSAVESYCKYRDEIYQLLKNQTSLK